MSEIIGNFHISYRIGNDFAEVRKIGYVDEYNRLRDMEFVFRGTWDECERYAREGSAI